MLVYYDFIKGINMPSSKEYLRFVLEQLQGLDNIKYIKMMGEYILYYKDKIFGGIYDNRLLIKNIEKAREIIKNPVYELPYKDGKEMILIENVDDKEYLKDLIKSMYDDLPYKTNRR